MKRVLHAMLPLALAMGLAGCTSLNEMLFGAAETPAQQAYQEKAKFVYVAIPLRNYVEVSDPDRGVVEAACAVEQIAYDAMQGAAGAALAGGDELTRALAAMSGGLASLSLEVFGQVAVPRPDELVARGVILARVGARSILEMRTWRRGFIEVKAEEFVAAGRDPTEQEWAQLDTRVDEIHGTIRSACEAPE